MNSNRSRLPGGQRHVRRAMLGTGLSLALLQSCGGGSGDGQSAGGAQTLYSARSDGVIELGWDGSTAKVDGSCATDIVAYRLNLGLSSGQYRWSEVVPVNAEVCQPGEHLSPCGVIPACRFRLENVTDASWYITIQAIDSRNNISGHSNEIIRVVSAAP